jgi:putative endonuclease
MPTKKTTTRRTSRAQAPRESAVTTQKIIVSPSHPVRVTAGGRVEVLTRGPRVAPDPTDVIEVVMPLPMKTWTVYLLLCADGTLYCGITTDLAARIEAHQAGKGARYTRGRRPVRLVYQEEAGTRSHALRREIQIKRASRAAKIDLARRARRRPLACLDHGRAVQ